MVNVGDRVRVLAGNPYDQFPEEIAQSDEVLFEGLVGTVAHVVANPYDADDIRVGVRLDEYRDPMFFPEDGWHMPEQYVEVL